MRLVSWRPRLRWRPETRRLVLFLVVAGAILGYLTWQWPAFLRTQAVTRRPPPGAALVSAPAGGSDFFAEARLERDRARSEERQVLQETAADERAGAETRAEARRRLMELARRAALEKEAESLIRAKGFPESVVFLNERGAVVVVRKRALTPAEAARIADAAAAATGVAFTQVRIIPYDR